MINRSFLDPGGHFFNCSIGMEVIFNIGELFLGIKQCVGKLAHIIIINFHESSSK